MVKIFIDDKAIEVKEGLTVLQAAKANGISIPHYCYHPAFAPEGSCRMCLVEIEGQPKLDLACSTIAKEGLKVRTRSPKVIEARKGVLEFYLAEHPLDCPICDKSGECLLQDYYEQFGLFNGQFKDPKEKREKRIEIGRKLLLDRERCILCTRCVRFLNRITRTEDAGIISRGVHAEISIYETELIENNYAGNLVDLCPVGAITDLDFRFKARVWFLEKKESICPHCSRGCNIFIDFHPGFPRVKMSQRVCRIRPRDNEHINFYWICDFGRYNYAYLDEQRHHKILMEREGHGLGLSREKTEIMLAEKMKGLISKEKAARIAVILNTRLTNEELFLADKIFREKLHLENIFVADPLPGKGDGFLLTEERTPNRRALAEIGIPASAPDLKTLAEKTDFLLVFGSSLTEAWSMDAIKSAFDKIRTKVLLTTHLSSLDPLVDIIIPTPLIAEKSGSLTNVEGRVQVFSPALEFRADGLPEWQLLLDLADEMKIDPDYFGKLRSLESIRRQMAKEIPFFNR